MTRARKVWLICAATLVVAVVATVATIALQPTTRSDLPAAMRAELDSRVAAILEGDPTFGQPPGMPAPSPSTCSAAVFGVAPREARNAAGVTIAYAWIECRWPLPGGTSDPALYSAASMPIALRFGPPPTYRIPRDGAGYTDSIREIFPRELRDMAFTKALVSR
jgi:hypothetical protein